MKFAYSNAQMRSFDEREIKRGTPVSVLMERAGRALAEAVKRAAVRLGADDIVFVCGGGNNGGDGFVAAELLRHENFDVAVLCLAKKFSPACDEARKKYGGELLGVIPRRIYGIAVDCLFGTGLSRPVEGENADLVSFINACRYVIACDLPTGLTEGGIALSPCAMADETVSMGQLKSALILSDGADVAGKISVADIGISAEGGVEVWEDDDVRRYFPKRRSNTNKGNYGSAHIFAGGALAGAAFLAAAASLKSGVGYTRLSVTAEFFHHVVGRLPAAILREFHAVDGEMLSSDCLAVGMGSGVSERLYAYICELLTAYTGVLVLDADALNTLSQYGVDILKNKTCRVIITPHPKEFSRLTGRSVEELLSSPVEAARAFSEEYGVTVVFKNNRTVIAEGERVAINPTGSPVLAKGGSGDVLAGLLAGTVARGVPPFEAAAVASYLLGRAGELAAAEINEYSPDATDIVAYLPKAIRSIM